MTIPYTVPLAGIELHFIHQPGVGPNPLPLLLSHGWPGSVWEFHKVIPLLTDPARFGGDPADAFTVVAPSLPGYGFSFRPGQPRFGVSAIADAFAALMTDALGYRRFVAQGGDWGAAITMFLAMTHPERTPAIHLNYLPLAHDTGPAATPEEEEEYLRALGHWRREETAYQAIQGTKPQTLAFGLTDSPAGLAAWIVEKFRTWSDCDGHLESVFTKDELLTNIMIYWVTGAIGSSFWPYYDRLHPGSDLVPRGTRIETPTAYSAFPREIVRPPRARAERHYNIQRWTPMPAGGHFAALEQPEALVEDVRAFFRDYRA